MRAAPDAEIAERLVSAGLDPTLAAELGRQIVAKWIAESNEVPSPLRLEHAGCPALLAHELATGITSGGPHTGELAVLGLPRAQGEAVHAAIVEAAAARERRVNMRCAVTHPPRAARVACGAGADADVPLAAAEAPPPALAGSTTAQQWARLAPSMRDLLRRRFGG